MCVKHFLRLSYFALKCLFAEPFLYSAAFRGLFFSYPLRFGWHLDNYLRSIKKENIY